MVTREDIFAEIQRVPDEHLDEVYAMLKQYEKNGEKSGDVSVMASLRAIKISASPDLSRRASLYELDKHDADQVATSLLVVPNPILEW